jgi:hypothetical protein
MHLHHLIPKHSSYFNYLGDVKEDPYYKVYLTAEGHACQHEILYRVFGAESDKIASDALMGHIGKEEAVALARADWIKRHPNHHSEAGKRGGKAPASERSRQVSSELARKVGKTPWWNDGIINRRSHIQPGPNFIKGRLPLWEGKREQPKSTCPHCGQGMSATNLSRHIAARH